MNGADAQSVIVVGGGLIGLFTAHTLAVAGHRVTVIERGSIGSGAARGNGGWVCPSRSKPMPSPTALRTGATSLLKPESALYLTPKQLPRLVGYLSRFAFNSSSRRLASNMLALDTLNDDSNRLFDALAEDGIALGLNENGFLPVHSTRAAAERSRAGWANGAGRGFSPEPGPILDQAALHSLEPALGPAARFGYLHHGDRWLDPSVLVDRLAAALDHLGVEQRTGEAVLGIFPEGQRVRVVTQSETHVADRAVIATGAWATDLLATVGLSGLVVPGKGYSFSVHPDTMPLHNIQCGLSSVAATPLNDRLRLVGTVEFDGTYDTLNPDRISLMRRGAEPFLEGIDWNNITDEWVAPRPMTPDGLPLIGEVPGFEQVIVATGHNMLGLSLGPATAQLVLDIMRGMQPTTALRAFEPSRFSRGRRRRKRTKGSFDERRELSVR